MTPQELLDRYVYDVTRRLPMRQRADVGAELRMLLDEELGAQPNGDLEAAKALLIRFGAPNEVAARYAPPALVVEQRDTGLFWQINGIVTLVLGAVAFVGAFASPEIASDPEASRLFYLEILERILVVIGSMTLVFWAIGAWRRRYPSTQTWKPNALPPVRDPDHVHRVGNFAAIIYFILGTIVLVFPTQTLGLIWGGEMPEPARAALTYDLEFRATRGPVMLVFIIAGIVILALAAWRERYSRPLRIAQIVSNVASAGVMVWLLRAGPIFISEPADQMVKLILAICAIVCLVDAGIQARRIWGAGASAAA